MNRATSQAITEIRQKLVRLAERDPDCQVFGSQAHRYALGPRLSQDRLSGMERDFRATLPEQYRAFLLELGNGGAGPYYGLFKLAGDDPEDLTDYGSLDKPFPWTEKIRPRRPSIPGALYICHYGCALRFLLVVTGKSEGEIWHDWQADGLGIYPACDAQGKRMQFFDWYLEWLDSALIKLSPSDLK
jgi:hypothetical protein